jgi:hypothetical protein
LVWPAVVAVATLTGLRLPARFFLPQRLFLSVRSILG